MKTLIIAEKPSVAKDISQSLGGNFSKLDGGLGFESDSLVVSSALGHLATLHVPEADGFPPLPIIPSQFQVAPIDDDTRKRLGALKKLIVRADIGSVINACDAGREGELIFYYLYTCVDGKKPVKRMWMQSMTVESIKEAFQKVQPAQAYQNLLNAARSRSEADWLVGINGSRAAGNLMYRMHGGRQQTSVGRVQTPTLALIVNRENEIIHFKSKDYFEVHGKFKATGGEYIGKWKQGKGDNAITSFPTNDESLNVVQRCTGNPKVTEETKPTSSAPPKLFDLTTLQREANSKFGLTAKQTLDVAQALYEKHKITSYPRTDSVALPEDYVGKAKEILAALPAEYQTFVGMTDVVGSNKKVFNNSRISDHFAIVPTGTTPEGLNDFEAKIFDLVVRRFIAAFMPNAEFLQTTRTTVFDSGDTFYSNGRVKTNEGWQAVYGAEASDDEPALCPIQNGETVFPVAISVKPCKTKPPKRFNEATLLGAMETAGKLIEDEELRDAMKEKGLGTPATRAPTIEGLITKEFITRQGKEIVPTPKGAALISFLDGNGINNLTSPEMTGDWEYKLALMEKGNYSRENFMREIAGVTMGIVSTFQAKEQTIPQNERESAPCPACGKPMYRYESKYKKGQYYWSCSGYREGCKEVMDDANGKPVPRAPKAPVSSEHFCTCGKPLAHRTGNSKGKDWEFWGCTGYPKCKKSFDLKDGNLVEKTWK